MARIIEFEGRRIEVPDDASDAEVQQILGASAPAAQAPAGPAAPPPVNQGMNAPVYVGQQADRGLADIVGAPVDLATAATNAGLWSVDKLAELFGGNMDARASANLPLSSDWIADKAASGYEALGGKVVAPEEVSSGVRVTGMGARGAAASLPMAFGLASGPVQALTQSGKGGSVVQSMAKPYASEAGATLARDAAAGAGAGVASGSYDEYTPDVVQESFAGPFLKALASIMGGVGGASTAMLAEGAAKAGANAGRNAVRGRGDPNAPVSPDTGKPFTRPQMDRAAYVAQQMPSDRGQAVGNIDAAQRDLNDFARPNQMPTVGPMADDVGMAIEESTARNRDRRPFVERDSRRQALASDNLDQVAPKGADGRKFTAAAERQYNDTLKTAEDAETAALAKQEAARTDIQRQNAELEAYRASQPQASSAMAEDFDAARRAGRAAKNERYAAVDPKTPVDNGNAFLGEAVKRIDAEMPQAERMAGGAYSDIAGRVRALAEGEQPVTYGDLKAIRAQISEARKGAVAASGQSVAGSGADVQRLDQLGAIVSRMTDQINPEAARFYSEEYAPRFKEGRAGEYGAAVDRSARTGGESSATRPSEFGDKFLRKPEDAASLKRAMEPLPTDQKQIAGPGGAAAPSVEPALARNARDWMLGDLAKSGVLTDNAEIRYDRFRAWADKNRATINQFPEIAREIDGELARAQRGGFLSKQLAGEVATAKEGLKTTRNELQRSALQRVLGADPSHAVGAVMGSEDSAKNMADLVRRMSGDAEATAGLKDAVRSWIQDDAGLTTKIIGSPDSVRLSRAKLERLFQQHEKTLAGIYSPDEMNALRRAHKLMDFEARANVQATPNSDTFSKIMDAQKATSDRLAGMREAYLKLNYGNLAGGGLNRTINIALKTLLPDANKPVDDILFQMWFDPDLAKHLLTRDVKAIESPAWNSKLNSLLAVATGARESVEGDDQTK